MVRSVARFLRFGFVFYSSFARRWKSRVVQKALLPLACLCLTGSAAAQSSDQCSITITTNPPSPAPWQTPITVTATLNGDVVVDTVTGSFLLDGAPVCTLGQGPSSCSGTVTPSVGSHTFTWSCTAVGAGGNGQNSGSQQLLVPLYSIGSTFFGMHLNQLVDPDKSSLNVPFGTLRLWDSGTTWALISPTPPIPPATLPVFDFGLLDAYLNWAQANNYEVIYTFGHVPSWENASLGSPTCSGTSTPEKGIANINDWHVFISALSNHAKGRIKYYEVWNEPDQCAFWNQDQTTQGLPLLKAIAKDAYQTIKANDPQAVVLTPAPGAGTGVGHWMDTYLSTALSGNDTNPYADIIAFHGYNISAHPESDPPENVLAVISGLQDTISRHGLASLPVWDTEASWGPNANPTPQALNQDQPAFLARSYTLQAAQGIGRFAWYGWDYVPWGTLWQPSGVHGAGIAYGTISQWLIGAQITACWHQSQDVWSCPIFRSGGYQGQILWSATTDPLSYTPSAAFTQSRDLLMNCARPIQNQQVTLGHQPIVVETPYPGAGGSAACWWEAVQPLLQ